MRIHTDHNTWSNLYDAARKARVTFDRAESFKSSIRESGFDITLRGESKRRPNYGTGPRPYPNDEFAATWDQWGVFLGHLFNIDPAMVCGTPKRPSYRDEADFEYQTNHRFARHAVMGTTHGEPSMMDTHWPDDAHGDHTFRFTGTPYENGCTKCTAIKRRGF